MTGHPTFQQLSRRTIDDHQQIDFFLSQLVSTLDSLDETAADTEPRRAIRWLSAVGIRRRHFICRPAALNRRSHCNEGSRRRFRGVL